jgi:hypothetical protein
MFPWVVGGAIFGIFGRARHYIHEAKNDLANSLVEAVENDTARTGRDMRAEQTPGRWKAEDAMEQVKENIDVLEESVNATKGAADSMVKEFLRDPVVRGAMFETLKDQAGRRAKGEIRVGRWYEGELSRRGVNMEGPESRSRRK